MLKPLLVALCIGVSLNSSSAERIRYEGYKIYKVIPETKEHISLLTHLKSSSDSLNYLDPIVAVNQSISVLAAPHKQPEFQQILNDNQINYHIVAENFQQILDTEIAELNTRSGIYDWSGYHTLSETYDWLDSLARKNPSLVEKLVAGTTYEGREIRGLKVSFKSGNKGIFLEGGIHANEWISPATVTYILNQIINSKDPSVRAVVEKFDWYVFPHYNPDGFVYTHTTDRLWRKTRSKGNVCYGADPNRNWDFHWREAGASDDECSRSYAGKSKFSEKETQTISEFLKTLKGKIDTYVAFHCFGQVLVYPYAATDQPAPNRKDLNRIAEASAAALSRRYGTQYRVGTIYDIIYPAAGSGPDWAYNTLDIPLSFTYELRPLKSDNGGILPSAQIVPTGEETFDSILAMIAEAEKLGYYK